MKGQSHENFSRVIAHEPPSSRSFGVVFAIVLAGLGVAPVLRSGNPRLGLIAAGAVLAGVAVLRPSLLDIPAAIWARAGVLLARITNPIVMSALFVLVFIPASALFRLLGKDPMRRGGIHADSWWVVRNPPGPPPPTMAKQF